MTDKNWWSIRVGRKRFSGSDVKVALRFKKASCVVVGTFNIYVVQPRLLAQLGLIPFGEPALVEQNLTQAGFRFIIESLQSQWTVRPDKLIVETTEPHFNSRP